MVRIACLGFSKQIKKQKTPSGWRALDNSKSNL
jgi:hypothetical protein